MTNPDFWIMRPFNGVFCLTFGTFLLLLIVSSLLLKNKSRAIRERVLIGACLLTFIGFFVYKYFLFLDKDFDILTADTGGFNWWGELPLQLCNINMILIPIAVWKKSRPLMCFGFFLGPLGAMMALAMPGTGFGGYPLFLPRMLGYYGTHFMVVIEGLALASFGLFRPRFRDLPRAILAAAAITAAVFLFNMLLRWTGLHPLANYFFSVMTEGNFLLDLFYSWIPVPGLYLLPGTVILAVYMLLVTTPFELAERRRAKKESQVPAGV